jgi:hypothetical protein
MPVRYMYQYPRQLRLQLESSRFPHISNRREILLASVHPMLRVQSSGQRNIASRKVPVDVAADGDIGTLLR